MIRSHPSQVAPPEVPNRPCSEKYRPHLTLCMRNAASRSSGSQPNPRRRWDQKPPCDQLTLPGTPGLFCTIVRHAGSTIGRKIVLQRKRTIEDFLIAIYNTKYP